MLSFLAPWESSESPHLPLVWESPIPFLTPTGSPGQQTGQFEPRVFLPRYCCWVFEFQVSCYEWVISSSISGELLWAQSPEAEWGWLRQRSTQSLMGPACGGLWDVEAGVRGVQGEHRGGLDVVMCSQRNSLLALLHSEEFEIFASDLKHKVVSHLKEMVYYESLMTCSSLLPSASSTGTSGFRYLPNCLQFLRSFLLWCLCACHFVQLGNLRVPLDNP